MIVRQANNALRGRQRAVFNHHSVVSVLFGRR
jgi:hypothetical protein